MDNESKKGIYNSDASHSHETAADLGAEDHHFVRHAGDGSSFTLIHAFKCAFTGIYVSITTQRNFKVHIAFAFLAIVLGFILRITILQWIAIIACIAAVFALETINTSVEAVVDLVSPEWNRLAKIAKDCSAGAVLIAAIASILIGCLVFIPQLIRLLS